MGVGTAVEIKDQEVRGWGSRQITYMDTEVTKNQDTVGEWESTFKIFKEEWRDGGGRMRSELQDDSKKNSRQHGLMIQTTKLKTVREEER